MKDSDCIILKQIAQEIEKIAIGYSITSLRLVESIAVFQPSKRDDERINSYILCFIKDKGMNLNLHKKDGSRFDLEKDRQYIIHSFARDIIDFMPHLY